MQAEDNRVCEPGTTGDCTAEGASSPDIRLSQDSNKGGADGPAEGVLALPDRVSEPVAPCDVRDAPVGKGAFNFLGGPESRDDQTRMCVEEIKAFVRGHREGLVCLKRVLPNIFRAYPLCPRHEALIEAGLEPMPSYPESEFPTFFFRPDLELPAMIASSVGRKRPVQKSQDNAADYRSRELLSAYEAMRSEWST